MKIRDLNILPKHFSAESYSGSDYSGSLSLADWILEKIENTTLFLKVRPELKEYNNMTGKIYFIESKFLELTSEEKEKIHKIFSENIGETIEKILNLDF